MDTASVDLLSLIRADVRLKKVATTGGGEWAGPCPFCGGAEKRSADRFRVWPAEGRFWCRRCQRSGDAIDYVRVGLGLGFGAALDRLGLAGWLHHDVRGAAGRPGAGKTKWEGEVRGVSAGTATIDARRQRREGAIPSAWDALPLPRHEPLEPPSDAWQGRAIDFCSECIERLWTEEGARARAWLVEKRGLNEQTIMDGSLGYNPVDRQEAPELWGFEADHRPVWLPRGITIPWAARGHAWRVNIRRPEGNPKYVSAAGSATALYRANMLASGRAAMLVEGEFDALTIWQHAGGIIAAVATGSTTAARRPRWLAPLAACGVVLVAFDSDEAGEEAAAYWLHILPKARRWRPYFGKDANDLAMGGGDVAAWILDGLGDAGWHLPGESISPK